MLRIVSLTLCDIVAQQCIRECRVARRGRCPARSTLVAALHCLVRRARPARPWCAWSRAVSSVELVDHVEALVSRA